MAGQQETKVRLGCVVLCGPRSMLLGSTDYAVLYGTIEHSLNSDVA